jgi:hypothetical protein
VHTYSRPDSAIITNRAPSSSIGNSSHLRSPLMYLAKKAGASVIRNDRRTRTSLKTRIRSQSGNVDGEYLLAGKRKRLAPLRKQHTITTRRKKQGVQHQRRSLSCSLTRLINCESLSHCICFRIEFVLYQTIFDTIQGDDEMSHRLHGSAHQARSVMSCNPCD